MTTRTVGDLVKELRQFHHLAAEHFRELGRAQSGDGPESGRIRMALAYLADHQTRLDTEMQRYLGTASPHVLEVWINLALTPDFRAFLDKRADAEPGSVEAVEELALALDDYLIDICRELAREADLPEASEVFTNLADQQEHLKRLLVRDIGMLADL